MKSTVRMTRIRVHVMRLVLAAVCLLLVAAAVFAASGRTKINVTPKAPNLVGNVTYTTQNGDNYIEPEKPGSIKLIVKNTGPGNAYDVNVSLKLDKNVRGLSFPAVISLGDIPVGKTVNRTIELSSGESLATALANLTVEITNESGFGEPDPWKIEVATKAFSAPKIVIVGYEAFDENNLSKLKPGTTYTLKARVQNQGRGIARGVQAEFEFQQNVQVADGDQLQILGNMKPGETKDIEIKFVANRKIKADQVIPISLAVNEERSVYSVKEELNRLVMNSSAAGKYKEIKQEARKNYDETPTPVVVAAEFGPDEVDLKTPLGARLQGVTKGDIAFLIGIKNYDNAEAVKWAINDLDRVYEYLVAMGFDKENIKKFPDATQMTFNKIFGAGGSNGQLQDFVEANNTSDGEKPNVFIYYVGHGVADKNSQATFFVAKDSEPNNISVTGFSVARFYKSVDKLPAKRVMVVIDACYSGQTATKGSLVTGMSPGTLRVKEAAPPEKVAVFTSAGSDQVSSWYDDKRHSMFTYYFLKGLLGEADLNKDRSVSYRELEDYVHDNVKRTSMRQGVKQDPALAWKNKSEKVIVFSSKEPNK